MASDRLHVSPWDLPSIPRYWRERALIAVQAELEAKGMKWSKRDA